MPCSRRKRSQWTTTTGSSCSRLIVGYPAIRWFCFRGLWGVGDEEYHLSWRGFWYYVVGERMRILCGNDADVVCRLRGTLFSEKREERDLSCWQLSGRIAYLSSADSFLLLENNSIYSKQSFTIITIFHLHFNPYTL